MGVFQMILFFSFIWIFIGIVLIILVERLENHQWPRRKDLIVSVLGLLLLFFMVAYIWEKTRRSGWWDKRLFEKDPYDYHKY